MKTAIPDPSPRNVQTQIAVHLEEVAEMIECISAHNMEAAAYLQNARFNLVLLSQYLKNKDVCISIEQDNREDYLDAICDQLVTATGCGANDFLDVAGGIAEVNRSNFSKFVDGKPIFNEHKKIMKGPDYFKPDLSKFV